MKYILRLAILSLFVFAYTLNSSAQCSMLASITKTNSDCQDNGTVTVKVVDTSQYINIRYALITKTGSSYPPSFQITETLQNVPKGIYDVHVAARCKSTGLDSVYNLGEVKIVSTYTSLENLYVYTSGVVKPLKGGLGRIPIRFEGGKAPYTVTIKQHPVGYTGPTVFTMSKDSARLTNNRLVIPDLPAGEYKFGLKDDCGSNVADQTYELEEFKIPEIKHSPMNHCWTTTSLVFQAFQMDDSKKIAVMISLDPCNYNNQNYHGDYASYMYYFGYGDNMENYWWANGVTPDSVVHENYYGGDTIRNGTLHSAGIRNFDIALVENDNIANKKNGKLSLKPIKVYEWIDSWDAGGGNIHYNKQTYYKFFFEVELNTLNFRDMYGPKYGGSNVKSPVSFMLKPKTSTQWTDSTLHYFDYRYPYANIRFDITGNGCNTGDSLYVAPLENWNSWIGQTAWPGYMPFLEYPVKVDVVNKAGVTVQTKTFPYLVNEDGWQRYWGSGYFTNFDSLGLYMNPKDTTMGKVDYDKYAIKFTDASGFEYSYWNNWWMSDDSIIFYEPKYILTHEVLSSCMEDGTTGLAWLKTYNTDLHDRTNNIWYHSHYGWNANNSSQQPVGYQIYNNGNYDYYYANIMKQFYVGTRIKYISGPSGQVIPADIVIPVDKAHLPVALFVDDPWGKNTLNQTGWIPYSTILPGTHKFEIIPPCGPRDTVSFVMAEPQTRYNSWTSNYQTNMHYNNWWLNRYNIDKVSAYIYSGNNHLPISGGTKIECIDYPPGNPPYHTNITLPSGLHQVFPFCQDYTGGIWDQNDVVSQLKYGWAEIEPGQYKFRVIDGKCGDTIIVNMNVPQPFRIVDSLDYTLDVNCLGKKLYPTGKIDDGMSNFKTYYYIDRLELEDGTLAGQNDYDLKVVEEGSGDFLQLQRNGTYYIGMTAWYPGYYNNWHWGWRGSYYSVQVKAVKYKQPIPALDPDSTYAFVCVGENVGQIGLKATGGYGNGPYKYQLIKKDGDTLTNYTGIFNYGDPNELLEYIITDESPEAIALDCKGFIHKKDRIVLDLNNPNILYTPTGGKYCAGDTLVVNCYSLGPGAVYNWVYPDGTTHTGQNQKRPNATTTMTGWYKVTVQVALCASSPPVTDSIYVSVYNSPSDPHVDLNYLEGCYGGAPFDLADSVGAVASSGCLLKWYHYVGPYLTEMTATEVSQVKFNNYTDQKFYVKQVYTTTDCESNLVEITLHSLYAPPGPSIEPIAPGCYNDSLKIYIHDPVDSLKYRLYNSSHILLDEQPGSNTLVVFKTKYPSSTFYVTAVGTSCESMRTPVFPTLLASAQGHLINVNNVSVCFNSTATLTATADPSIDNPQFNWYASMSDTATILGSGNTFVVNNVRKQMYYYVGVKGDNFCESLPNQRRQVYISILQNQGINVKVTPPSARACGSFSGLFTASTDSTLTSPPATYRWYDKDYNLLATGQTFTNPTVTQETVYYVSGQDGASCESSPNLQATVRIEIGGIDSLSLSYEHLIGCDNKGSVLYVDVHGGAMPFEYKLDTDTAWIEVSGRHIVLPGLVSGIHNIAVKDFCGTKTGSLTIPPHPEGEIDTTVMSYSDGPAEYGIAKHIVSGCVYLGGLNLTKIQSTPAPSIMANTAQNDDAFDNLNYDGNGFIDLTTSDITVDGSGNLILNIKATNKTLMTGYIFAWLDVNKDTTYTKNEIIGRANVAPGSNNITVSMNCGQAYRFLRNDKMYLRLRMTTQSFMGTGNTDPYRKLGNGEVEDYLLEFPDFYTFTKEVSVKGKPGATEASKGDTLIYRLDFENNSPYNMCFSMFDTIPAGTKYISGGDYRNSNVLHWGSACVGAGGYRTVAFQVEVNDVTVGLVENTAYFIFDATSDILKSNTVEMPLNAMDLVDDYVGVLTCDSIIVDVLLNDTIAAGSTITISKQPEYGTAILVGNQVKYVNKGKGAITCDQTGGLIDTIVYKVCNAANTRCKEANVIISLLRDPNMGLKDACSTKPYIMLEYQYLNAKYDWYYSADNGVTWTAELTGTTQPSLNITKEGIYKVKIHYNGKSYEIPKGLEVYFNRKITLPGGVPWYDLGSNATNVSW